jgi:glutathione S-transferase
MRARLALAVSCTRYEVREVSLRAKPAEMLAASSKGTVPVLVLPDGEVIDESLEIMRWALTGCDPEGWLQRDDPALICANDGSFKQDLDGYKYPDRHAADPLDHRQRGLAFLQELEGRLTLSTQLCGSTRGMTDAAIVPFVRQFAAIDPEWFAAQPLPQLRSWLQDHLNSGLFQSIMSRVPHWTPGNLPTHFPQRLEVQPDEARAPA